MTKNQEVLLMVRYFETGDKVRQHFTIVKKQKSKYLLNSRYTLNKKFEKFIEDNALSLQDDNYSFCSKTDQDNEIIMEFDRIDSTKKRVFNSFFANIAGVTPTSDGCDECKHLQIEDVDSFYCLQKEKHLDKRLKTCRFFKQKENE